MSKHIDADKLTKAIEDKGLDCSFALKMERLDTLALIDELQQKQPDGLYFTPIMRLIQKIPSENWNDTVNNYAKKLRDCLIKEGYRKDAEVLQGYISYMNGNNVPMATMDEQERSEVQVIQWTGHNLKEVIDFTGKSPRFGEWFKSWEEYENYVHTHNDILKLFCEDGSHYEVPVGAWIVKTPDGHNVPSVAKYVQQKQFDIIDSICTKAGIPAPYKDGNQWSILKGANIQEGVVGFGDTKAEAMANFIKEIPIQQEQSVVDLEEEIERIVKNEEKFMKFQVRHQLIGYVARHFAEWGATHLNARKE